MSSTARMPEKPTLEGLEERWSRIWDEQRTYAFDRTASRDQVFSIDTPPPTVSGSLHVGTVFGYAQVDCVARFRRMRGERVFYPMGWDDNGLPTERRVQNYYGVRCDPALAYDPDFAPPAEPDPKNAIPVSRPNFVALCERLTATDEQAFEELFRRLGLSVDWSLAYTTIGDRARAVSQRAFLHDLARGDAYTAEAPTLWDITFRTAVAQAELEDRDRPGAYHRIGFHGADGEPVLIETTRPELLPACVALVAHPDDSRYRPLFGRSVTTPVFGAEVPVVAHPLADPEKGSGIAMICTFGDTTDVVWWRELALPTRAIVGRDGRLLPDPPAGLSDKGTAAYEEVAGKTVFAAREAIVALLRDSGDLVGEPRPITHPVKFFEKGDRPLEIVTSRQWYLRNGGRDEAQRERLLARGAELSWSPAYMRARYENWVGGLNSDWLVSRQRFFGVPFPLWYRLDDAGTPLYDDPITADESALPVDPQAEVPPGFTADQRGVPGGFTGDPDVMDTWATSSLTPQIAGGWGTDLFDRVFPMTVRPQGHDIIRTWLFSTVVRSDAEFGSLPWEQAMINGWILDPDRKKMSKSKGNVVTPMDLLVEHGADAVRYWAASGRPGVDTAFDTGQMKVGRRLAMKVLNASRFVLGTGVSDAPVTEPLDRALLTALAGVVDRATAALDAYDYTRALEATEEFFWAFCDDYVEVVKVRAYDTGAASDSARAALATALSTLLLLFAPFLPFVTEEVWSWWRDGSVHRQGWPSADALLRDGDPALLATIAAVASSVRKAKSEAQLSQRAAVDLLTITADAGELDRVRVVAADLAAAGTIAEIAYVEGPVESGRLTAAVTLAAGQ
ncbi:MAG TPA: valine--tRNA ligase [Mycobacteriales bacterium]